MDTEYSDSGVGVIQAMFGYVTIAQGLIIWKVTLDMGSSLSGDSYCVRTLSISFMHSSAFFVIG